MGWKYDTYKKKKGKKEKNFIEGEFEDMDANK